MTIEKIEEITKTIATRFEPEKVILFGSYAWGSPGPDSDVDLCVIKETENSRELAKEIDGSIFPRFFPLDLFVSNPKDVERREKEGDFFMKDILSKGRTLYARPN